MMAAEPVRKHVNISARDSAQLELRLHWFARALAERQGYIVALLRRSNASGRQVATVSYDLQLPTAVPQVASPRARRSAPRHGAGTARAVGKQGRAAQGASSSAL